MSTSLRTRLADLLKTSGMTANELARESQIDYATVYRIVNGDTQNPSKKTLAPIAKTLNVSLDWLQRGVGPKQAAVTEATLLQRAMAKLEDQIDKKDELIDKLTTLLMGKPRPTEGTAYLAPTGTD